MATSKPASKKTNKTAVERTRKGTTSKRRATLTAPLLLLPAIIALLGALARGLPDQHHGQVPDWAPSPERTAQPD